MLDYRPGGCTVQRMNWGIVALFCAVMGLTYVLVQLGWLRDW